mgnify:CR=1 FL=1
MGEQFDRHHASGGGLHGGMDGSGGTAFDQCAQLQSAEERNERTRERLTQLIERIEAAESYLAEVEMAHEPA